jgi:hypothetical protein
VRIEAFERARAGMSVGMRLLEKAAAEVALRSVSTATPPSIDTVEISRAAQGAAEAENAAQTEERPAGSTEEALIDQRIAKYVFVANLRVAQTAEEMSDELTRLGRR